MLTFLVGSFGLGLLIASFESSLIPCVVVNALFVAFTMTFFINKFIAIAYKKETRTAIFFMLLLAYWIVAIEGDYFCLHYHIHFRFVLFNIFQLFLIVPLTLGMTLSSRASAAAEKNVP